MLTGALALVIGMVWGIQMSASGDNLLSPTHGHLNLIAPLIAMAINGMTEALAIIGSFLALGSILVFTWTVYRFGIGANS